MNLGVGGTQFHPRQHTLYVCGLEDEFYWTVISSGASQARPEGPSQLGLLQVNRALLLPKAFSLSATYIVGTSPVLPTSPGSLFSIPFYSSYGDKRQCRGLLTTQWWRKHPAVWLSASASWLLFTTSVASQQWAWALKPPGPGWCYGWARCPGGHWVKISIKGRLLSPARSCFIECEPVLTAFLEFYMNYSNF